MPAPRREEFIGTATKAGIVFPQPKTKEVASPGLRKLQTGKMEIEDIKITLQDYPARVIAMVGHPESMDKALQLIGVIGPKDPRTITITASGPWNSLEEFSDWYQTACRMRRTTAGKA